MKSKILLFLFVVALFTSCNKIEKTPAPSSIINGKRWKLVSYNLNGTEIVGLYKNCTILFNTNGTLSVVNDGKNYSGTWKEFSDPPKVEMNISSSDNYVKLLSKTWETLFLTPGRIQLADSKINPGETIKLDLIP